MGWRTSFRTLRHHHWLSLQQTNLLVAANTSKEKRALFSCLYYNYEGIREAAVLWIERRLVVLTVYSPEFDSRNI